VVFTFSAERSAASATAVTLVELAVEERGDDSLWRSVWEVRGPLRVESICYGEGRGLNEAMPAKPLVAGRVYRVIAKADRSFGSRLYGSAEFVIDASSRRVAPYAT
jgi:hypothetical protein